ncbi:MAG: type IV pilus twitching motility protein PilT [Puniceicoccales bacterium]|jgi:twitching motility protein PilT|nr:type IV pilus twitching motility protein PilT [Puniceicoccales bacterium]
MASFTLEQLLDLVVEYDASDLHLHVGQAPALRVHGEITTVECPPLTPEDTEGYVNSALAILTENVGQNHPEVSAKHKARLESEHGGSDFGFAYTDPATGQPKARFRTSIFKSKGHCGMVLRLIPYRLLGLQQIGLPDKIKDLLNLPRGLVLVTGPTGSGKTTTLASMLNWINENQGQHIITIEDPIEYYHPHKRSIVTQRELGNDVPSFAEAIRAALRQDPDVMLVGEMRDLETIEAAITAAETGHLVFATLHTTGAARTVDRIIDAFPANTKEQIRIQLAANLRAVISQVLCKRRDGKGRVAGFEIMVNNPSISAHIRDNKTHYITSDIQTGAVFGMMTLDTHLLSLLDRGLIDKREAIAYAQDVDEMQTKVLQR